MQRLLNILSGISRFFGRGIAASTRFWSKNRPWWVVIALAFVLPIIAQSFEMAQANLVATGVFVGLVALWVAVMVYAAIWYKPKQQTGESAIPDPNPPATREGASNAP